MESTANVDVFAKSSTMEDDKKRRILEKNNIAPPVVGRCGFFVKRKQRYCKMLPAKGDVYCAEHLQFDTQQGEGERRKRIPCPLDPNHSIFEDKLKKHLKKCNVTLKTKLPFYSENINLGIKDYVESQPEKEPLHCAPKDELKTLIERLRGIYNKITGLATSKKNSIHSLLQYELKKEEESTSLRKHLVQQGSLLNILHDLGSFRDQMNVIEFGAGRGTLSHWVQKAMEDKEGCQYFLVDRQHNRNKLDCYHKGDDQGPSFQRLNIDIQHLDLHNVESLASCDSDILAIGKHLCGGATDLSLRCIFDQPNQAVNEEGNNVPFKKMKTLGMNSRLHSLAFALCCYHRCTWSTYVGVDYLKRNGITPVDFHRLSKMATWSTCGFHRRKDDEHIAKEEEDHENEDKFHVKLGLNASEQETIGIMCKRIIDEGRLQYIRSHGYHGELVEYTDKHITPENIALVVKRQ